MRYVQIKIVWGLISANEYSLLKVIPMGTKEVVSLTHQPMDLFQKELHGCWWKHCTTVTLISLPDPN